MNRASVGGALALVAVAGCAPVPLGDGEKRIVVTETAATVILPTLEALAARAETLDEAGRLLSEEPSQARLDTARSAWRDARVPWKETDAFAFGPAMDARLAVAIDQWPVDRADLEEEVAGTHALTPAYVEALGANRKGFHAIEHFLFRADAGDDGVLAALTTDEGAARRRALLALLTANLARKAAELGEAWAPDGGDYVGALTDPGTSNDVYPTIKSSVDTLVNESVFLSEWVADARLGKPFGTASGGVPQPELEESGPSDNSVADMVGSLRSIRNIYLGSRTGVPERGIHLLVAAQSPVIDRAAREAIDHALAAVEAIPRPYRTALATRDPAVQSAYDAVKALKRVLTADVVGVLGAVLKFNDNDGD